MNPKHYKMSQQPIRIVISGGGTGGHIFPAIAIADALRRQEPDAVVLFVGAKNKMEMDRVPKAGYEIKGLWISGIQRKLSWKNLLFPLKLMSSLLNARKILKSFQPDIVVGVGGYASGPTLRAAIQLGIPTLIQEQNSFPGITNRMLAKNAKRICVAYEHMDKWFQPEKTILTGNPLRNDAVQIAGKREQARAFFELSTKKVVLVVGGSQGALGINLAIAAQLQLLVDQNIGLIWQTGVQYESIAKALVMKLQGSHLIKVTPFIDRMDLAYAATDLVVSRAGAMAISELAIVKKPVIFVPLPSAAEDHQTKNALRLVEAVAAQMVSNSQAKDTLVPEIVKLLNSPEIADNMAANLSHFAQPDAAEKIVKVIKEIVRK